MSAEGKKTGVVNALRYAWCGVVSTFKREPNFRIELAVACGALLAAFILALEPVEWAVILLLILIVLSLELANSALESVCDLASKEVHPLAKQAKDAMAGAVLIAAVGAVIIGLIVYINAALRIGGV